ncbi:hypothetical protein [Shewanella litorisediminis]|uniref:Rap1a immunity protein domain-containing protein n=1 Tax=Shewanella litorisediminis TaxID=1173586 RepID=A0ABX7G5M6_9GAMM|nr:hypothetical protein [Shewanella litorisediminis]MCL2917486.1 hypothetical protein [Shewanella litorisediminis]QRH02616.1 hypothetical protein JQC75_04115 [Shewanella litorisediminis]
MRLNIVSVLGLSLLPLFATASGLKTCADDSRAPACQQYLEGVVDGALMYKTSALGARPESDGFESRALKYRSGSRFQDANRRYCVDRIPDRNVLVEGLTEAVSSGEVKDQESLAQAMYSLLDCQRLK